MPKSSRNKTIEFNLQEAPKKLIDRVMHPSASEQLQINEIMDKSINGDSFSVMKQLPSKFVDLALVDPPYNLNKKYDGLNFRKMTDSKYQEYTQEWIDCLKPLLKDNASIYVFSDWATSIEIAPILKANFNIQNRITWQREKGRGALRNWKNSMEDIWFLTLNDNYVFNVDDVKMRRKVIAPYRQDGIAKDWEETTNGNFRDTMPSNFWDDISVPYWSMPENTAHPTQKPEKLLAKIILASSNKDNVIFDPFSGSGTSLVVANKLQRHYVGIEQSELYTVWGEYRLAKARDDTTIQGYTDGVFWERNTLSDQKRNASQKVKNMRGKDNDAKRNISLF